MVEQFKKCPCRSVFCDYEGETLVDISAQSSILNSSPRDTQGRNRENPMPKTLAQYADIAQRPDRYSVEAVRAAIAFWSTRDGREAAAFTKIAREHLLQRSGQIQFRSAGATRQR
jgi:hypothetical protein